MCYILPQSVVFPMDYSTIRLILIAIVTTCNYDSYCLSVFSLLIHMQSNLN